MHKCEQCRHHKPAQKFTQSECTNPKVVQIQTELNKAPGTRYLDSDKLPILRARYLCDREGDGIFIHYEPKDPESGAVAIPPGGNTTGRECAQPAAAGARQ